MISVIVAVRNQLPMNRLFVQFLKRYTHNTFELIVVDNDSDDGTAEFFAQSGATVVNSGGNYSYPVCQNIGIRAAKFDWLAFLNNDLLVGPQWDERMLEAMDAKQSTIVSATAPENMGSKLLTRWHYNKWKLIKRFYLRKIVSEESLLKAHRCMFPHFESYCNDVWNKHGIDTVDGFAGSNFLMHRNALEKVGWWDERIQSADFDLYLRTMERYLSHGDVQPVKLLRGVYMHHFMKLTQKASYKPFDDAVNLTSITSKWSQSKANELLKSTGLRIS